MISILGAGAIGQLIAHKLTEASVDCQLIVKDGVKDESNYADSWHLQSLDGDSVHKIPYSKISDTSQLELVAVCVKAPQLVAALTSIKHRINNKTQLILMLNGMGHEAIAKQLVSDNNIFFASNTHGAFKNSKQSIQYAGKGSIQFGALEEQEAPAWFYDFNSANLNSIWQSDINSVLLRKLLVNACINPLTAIYQCKNGELLDGGRKARLLALINENQNFADAIHLEFESNLKDLVIKVIEQTADNYNSMYQDVNRGRETEITAINGYLLDLMTKSDFNAPHNWQLWSDFHISFPPLKAKATERAKAFDALQFQVTQQAATERPFTGTYNQHSETGDYSCACCDSVLFDDKGKFDSHCGWPSFDQAKNNKAIAYREDLSHGMSRTEILCAQCGSHLGHVFEDGPTDTGVRFCVNSVSLNFLKQD